MLLSVCAWRHVFLNADGRCVYALCVGVRRYCATVRVDLWCCTVLHVIVCYFMLLRVAVRCYACLCACLWVVRRHGALPCVDACSCVVLCVLACCLAMHAGGCCRGLLIFGVCLVCVRYNICCCKCCARKACVMNGFAA